MHKRHGLLCKLIKRLLAASRRKTGNQSQVTTTRGNLLLDGDVHSERSRRHAASSGWLYTHPTNIIPR
jgi:hypothetical protein